MGTPYYIAPEIEQYVFKGIPVNIKFDIFQIGCIFVQFLIILQENYHKNIYKNLFVCPINGKFIEEKRYNYSEYFVEDLFLIREILVAIGIKPNLIESYIDIISHMINPNPEELMSGLMQIRTTTIRLSNNGKTGNNNNSLTVLPNAGGNGL